PEFEQHTHRQALTFAHALLELGSVPELDLTFGPDRAGRDGVDANARGAVLAGHRPSEACDRGLASAIRGQASLHEAPDDRSHINDAAAAEALHLWRDGLGGEEHVAEVGSYALVPVCGGDGLEGVAVVAGGVVNENGNVTDLRACLLDGGAQGFDVAHVAAQEHRLGRAAGADFFGDRSAGLFSDVDEDDARTLLCEGASVGGTDAAGSAGDENKFAGEARVNGGSRVGHILASGSSQQRAGCDRVSQSLAPGKFSVGFGTELSARISGGSLKKQFLRAKALSIGACTWLGLARR